MKGWGISGLPTPKPSSNSQAKALKPPRGKLLCWCNTNGLTATWNGVRTLPNISVTQCPQFRSCPRLRSLSLPYVRQCSVSKNVLIRFLNMAKFIEVLNIGSGFKESWSKTSFNLVSRITNIKVLKIPFIKDG